MQRARKLFLRIGLRNANNWLNELLAAGIDVCDAQCASRVK
jgi:hypothetical protein